MSFPQTPNIIPYNLKGLESTAFGKITHIADKKIPCQTQSTVPSMKTMDVFSLVERYVSHPRSSANKKRSLYYNTTTTTTTTTTTSNDNNRSSSPSHSHLSVLELIKIATSDNALLQSYLANCQNIGTDPAFYSKLLYSFFIPSLSESFFLHAL